MDTYAPIRDYAVIGDCHGAALVSRAGGIDWCCLESFDADPVLAPVVDARRGGAFTLRAARTRRATRGYVGATNILRTVFETETGRFAVTDFMPVWHAGGASPGEDAALHAPHHLIRLIDNLDGQVSATIRFRPLARGWRPGSGLQAVRSGVTTRGGPALYADIPFAVDGDTALARVQLAPGARHALILAAEASDPQPDPAQAQMQLARTRQYWESWGANCCYAGRYPQAVRRSLLTLKLLTYAPTGAMVAAATTSLPEQIGGTRNWDYRYCWLRDSALTLMALGAMGHRVEAHRFFAFQRTCCERRLPELQVLYGVRGQTGIREWAVPEFEGYCGSGPVRVGNAASVQTQDDIYGEVLDCAYTYRALGGRLESGMLAMLRGLADYIAAHWREPDQGLWEARSAPRHYVHGKLMCWAALDRAIRLFADNPRWERERSAIVQAVHARGIDRRGGHLLQAFDGSGTDAAVLLAPQIGFPLRSGALGRTVEAVQAELRAGDYVRRYRSADGLAGEEGAFLMCSFWLVDALLFLGREGAARALFERVLAKSNDVGLYAEEADPASGAFLGNFPQAFTHLTLVNGALNLQLHAAGGVAALAGTHADRARRCAAAFAARESTACGAGDPIARGGPGSTSQTPEAALDRDRR